MKILILSDACFNDSIFPMYKAMLEKGLDVTCLINLTSLNVMLIDIKKRLPQQAIIPAYEYEEIRKYQNYVDLSRMYFINHDVDGHLGREIVCAIDIAKFIRRGKYDVIHCDFHLNRGKLLLYLFRNKFVVVQHDPFPHTGAVYRKDFKFNMWLTHRLIKKLVILNNHDYDRFCSEFKLNPNNVFINKLGPLDCINLFKSSDVEERKNNVLFFGRIVKYKGIEYLCKAMLKVHQVIPDATLTIAGSGKFYFDIDEYKKYPFIEVVNRFIKEDELADFIQKSTLTVCAYTDATQSGSALTSMAMLKPVIASDIETMREIITDGYDGILVPPCDSESLADAIINLLQDNNKRNRIIENIKNDFTSGEKSWSGIVDKYLEIYRK